MVAICGWMHDGRGRGEAPERCRPPALFDEKERMVVARINRICNFAITYFTDKSEFPVEIQIKGKVFLTFLFSVL